MNLPNQLTISRLVLTLLFVLSLSIPWAWSSTVGLAIFVAASLTDYLDGELARRWKLESNFGRLMDPLADKVMMAAALICLVDARVLPAWAAIAIIAREFMITGLRLLAASHGVVLPAEKLGKHKMAWQIVLIISALLNLSLREIFVRGSNGSRSFPPLLPESFAVFTWVGVLLVLFVVGLTVYSGIAYLWKHRALIQEM